MRALIIVLLLLTSCEQKPKEYSYHNEYGEGVYNVSARDFEDAVEMRFHPCGCFVDSVKVLNKKPAGAASNWFSGNSVYYEIEYRIYYRKVK